MNIEILKAALQGLCASSEVSIRSPKSIAEKAVQIAKAVDKAITPDGTDVELATFSKVKNETF